MIIVKPSRVSSIRNVTIILLTAAVDDLHRGNFVWLLVKASKVSQDDDWVL